MSKKRHIEDEGRTCKKQTFRCVDITKEILVTCYPAICNFKA